MEPLANVVDKAGPPFTGDPTSQGGVLLECFVTPPTFQQAGAGASAADVVTRSAPVAGENTTKR